MHNYGRSFMKKKAPPQTHKAGDLVQWDMDVVDRCTGDTVQSNDFVYLYGRGPFKVMAVYAMVAIGQAVMLETKIGAVPFSSDWLKPAERERS